MKGSLVGASEAAIRSAFKVIKTIAGKQAYFVATCNRMDSLPPELRRRFVDGIWFCDLPNSEERDAIWKINRKRYSIHQDDKQPEDHNFTGADIRNVCSIAYRLKISLKKAAQYITPIAKSDPLCIERLRKLANKSFLSASKEGVYSYELGDIVGESTRVLS
jgi:SpoVK/Ycf46/Vps4 family AAA+-type ATPase